MRAWHDFWRYGGKLPDEWQAGGEGEDVTCSLGKGSRGFEVGRMDCAAGGGEGPVHVCL